MNRLGWLMLAALLVPAAAHADAYLEARPRDLPTDGIDRLRVQYPAGGLHIEGDDGNTIRFVVRVHCRHRSDDDCQTEVSRLHVDPRTAGRTLVVDFQGIHKEPGIRDVEVQTRMLVPRRLAARVEMGFGELVIDGLAGDVDVELGVGDLELRGDPRRFREAEAAAGVGDASIRTRGGLIRERGFIGHTANWDEGRGASSIHARVGVGSARIVLD